MLPHTFLSRPFAHRGLHDLASGVPENSRAAIRVALQHGYGIEIDLQLTADGAAVVFHDYHLERLTDGVGRVRAHTARDLSTLRLQGSGETVPDFPEVLAMVNGQVPLLVDMKEEDGSLGEEVGELEAAVARALDSYPGPVAVMSFNPHGVSAMQTLAPEVPRGLVTEDFLSGGWTASPERLSALNEIPDYDRVGASFISHIFSDLDMPAVAALKARGVPVLCWTIRSAEEEAEARRIADNVTFEGYFPDRSA